MKSINQLKKESTIILVVIAIIMIYSLVNQIWGMFAISLFAFGIVQVIYEIRMKLTEDRMKHENYENLKRIVELEEKKNKKDLY